MEFLVNEYGIGDDRMPGIMGVFDDRLVAAIPKGFGRGVLNPLLKVLATGFLVLFIGLAVCYPFPLELSDIPGNSSKAFTAIVITSHRDGVVQGVRATEGGREPFVVKDSEAEGDVLRQLRKYDMAHSRAFRTVFWTVTALWILLARASAWVAKRFPDLPEFRRAVTRSSMEEYKEYMRREMEAHGKVADPLALPADAPRGDQWYRKPYWNEVAMACVLVVTFATALGFWRYLNPDAEGNVDLKTAGKGVGAMKIESYPDPSERNRNQ